MSGRIFFVLIGLIAVVVAIAMVMLNDSGAPDGPEPPVTVTDGDNGQPVRGPGPGPDIDAVNPGDGTTDPSRVTATTDERFDPTGELRVSGRVTDALTGEPVVDADVEIFYPDGDDFQEATTGDDGSYEIVVADGIPAMVDFKAYADGYSALSKVGYRIDKATRALTVNFELHAAFTVEGRVTAAVDGSPVAGADLEIRSRLPMYDDAWDDAETDANGFYRFQSQEEIPRENFDVWVDSSHYVPMVKNDLSVPPGAESLVVDFVLWGELTIRGVIVSALTNQPIEDAEISAASPDPEFIDDGEDELTEEDGSFALELDAVPYDKLFVLVSAEEHSAVVIDPVPMPDANGVINLGTIALRPAVRLAGVVVNSKNGVPVKGGDITIYAAKAPDRDEGEYCDSEFIDENTGRFEIDLEYAPPGGAEILIEAEGAFPKRVPLVIPPNIQLFEVRYEVEPVVTFRGTVKRKADGTPVAGAQIRLLGSSEYVDEDSLIGRSRADGTFVLELPASEAERFGVVIEYSEHRFPVGKVPPFPPGSFNLSKDYVVDVPPMRRGG